MANQWESREKRVKRIALIVSVFLHIGAIAMITTSFGSGGVRDLIESVFGTNEAEKTADNSKV